jgi:hypothetical protein
MKLIKNFDLKKSKDIAKRCNGKTWQKISDYCSHNNPNGKYESYSVKLDENEIQWIWGQMLYIEYDTISFQLHIYSDNTFRIYASYGSIIGSRVMKEGDLNLLEKILEK